MGGFLVWEPDTKSPGRHRLVDSDRPSTTFFKLAQLKVDSQAVTLKKNRHMARILVFLLLMPVGGGLVIGSLALLWNFFGHFFDHYAGIVVLIGLGVTAAGVGYFVCWIIKPLRRQFPFARITNVHTRPLQRTYNGAPTGATLMGVDFFVAPPASPESSAVDANKAIDANLCSFVTLLVDSAQEAASFVQWLPKKQVRLAGRPDPDIPPQQNATWVQPQVAAGPGSPPVMNNLLFQQRFSHTGNPWKTLLVTIFFGALMVLEYYGALTNKGGVTINGIHLGPTAATILLAFFAILGTAMFVYCAALTVQCFINPHSIEIRPDGIVLWNGWFKPKPAFVAFAAIQGVARRQNVKGGPRTMIIVAGNKKYQIQEAGLASRKAFDTIDGIIIAGQRQIAATRNPPVPAAPIKQNSPPPSADDDSRYMPKA